MYARVYIREKKRGIAGGESGVNVVEGTVVRKRINGETRYYMT
jgi:hypothetical protein